ncbi:uncharacterized protein LOC115562219 [Drosophila navojoa]|uniref:uncharacterized protein LOC115562219 n=1 Tax=Drosophila navojoa TaxID=7232 RepID=UPI0011BE59BE|nr:uncharacterized protein LOC115562219 [Drosophila navojoa]
MPPAHLQIYIYTYIRVSFLSAGKRAPSSRHIRVVGAAHKTSWRYQASRQSVSGGSVVQRCSGAVRCGVPCPFGNVLTQQTDRRKKVNSKQLKFLDNNKWKCSR